MKGFARTCLSASYPLTSSGAKQSSKFQAPSGAETIQGLLPSPPSPTPNLKTDQKQETTKIS